MSMNKHNDFKRKYPLTSKWATRLNIALLFFHIGYLVWFALTGIRIMAIFNIFSVLLYTSNIKIIPKNPILGLKLIYFEILLHYLMAVQCVGWFCGFQDYCFSAVVVAYFIGYALDQDGIKGFNSTFFSLAALVVFVGCWIEAKIYPENIYYISSVLIESFHFVNVLLNVAILIIFSYIFVNKILAENDMLLHNAEYDELTNLPNRHNIERIKNSYHIDEPDGTRDYALAIIDIDDFKKVNDTYGHQAGDYTLQMLARKLEAHKTIRTEIGRWGGEEFIIWVAGESAMDILLEDTEKFRKELEEMELNYQGISFKITVSIGVSYAKDGLTFDGVLKKADEGLYKAKNSGKNQVVAV